MNYLYGFISAAFVYWSLSYCFPAEETLLKASIYDDDSDVLDGVQLASSGIRSMTSEVRVGSKSQIAVHYTDTRVEDGGSQASSKI
jgi:NCS1 family nucleobase:cation symporter-1